VSGVRAGGSDRRRPRYSDDSGVGALLASRSPVENTALNVNERPARAVNGPMDSDDLAIAARSTYCYLYTVYALACRRSERVTTAVRVSQPMPSSGEWA